MAGAVAIVALVLLIAFLFRQYSLFVAESASSLTTARTVSSTLSFTTSVPVLPTVTPLPTQVPTTLPVKSQTPSTTISRATITSSETTARVTITPTPAVTPTPVAPLTLSLHFLRTCWLRVIVDGKMVFEGTLQPGSIRTWTAQQFITVRLGNAGGVDVIFNGKNEGVAGRPGEVVDRTYRLG
jgi:cytoskeletal protein RodZ